MIKYSKNTPQKIKDITDNIIINFIDELPIDKIIIFDNNIKLIKFLNNNNIDHSEFIFGKAYENSITKKWDIYMSSFDYKYLYFYIFMLLHEIGHIYNSHSLNFKVKKIVTNDDVIDLIIDEMLADINSILTDIINIFKINDEPSIKNILEYLYNISIINKNYNTDIQINNDISNLIFNFMKNNNFIDAKLQIYKFIDDLTLTNNKKFDLF